MKPSNLPTPIVRGAMHVTPPFVLARAVAMQLHGMERAHPKLFRNLAQLKPSIVYVEPTDLPHRFELKYGGDDGPCSGEGQGAADAYITGNLDILMSLLEGRIDGDALFFTRGLVITGDTAAIVGLRNTLDRLQGPCRDQHLPARGRNEVMESGRRQCSRGWRGCRHPRRPRRA